MPQRQNGVPRWVEDKLEDHDRRLDKYEEHRAEAVRNLDQLAGKMNVLLPLLTVAAGLLGSLLTVLLSTVLRAKQP